MFRGLRKIFIGECNLYASEIGKNTRRARKAFNRRDYQLTLKYLDHADAALRQHPLGGIILLHEM